MRVGNGAAEQLQLDIYGEAMDSLFIAHGSGLELPHRRLAGGSLRAGLGLRQLGPARGGHLGDPGGREPFTYGRLMCWVALDRGIRLASEYGRPADLDRWMHERDRIYAQILDRGWSGRRQAFVQHYRTEVLDSALLRMPRLGFVAPRDPLWLSTLDAMETELVTDSPVYRYDPAASPDGLRGSEGTFSLCTFAYVDALARAGRLTQARNTFEKMLTYANHVGLFSEEIARTGEQIGTSRRRSPTSGSSTRR